MESPGDFYAIALHDDQLRAGLTAQLRERRAQRTAPTRGARSALAVALRALAGLVDAPPPTATADRPLAVSRT
jgi:hypothetical protein